MPFPIVFVYCVALRNQFSQKILKVCLHACKKIKKKTYFTLHNIIYILTWYGDVSLENCFYFTGVLFSTLERLNQAELEIHTLKSKTKQLDLLETDIYTLRKENRLLFKELLLLRSACVTPSKTETLSDADKLMNSTYNVPILNKRLLLDNRKYLCTIYRKTTDIGKGLIFGCVYVYIYMVNKKLSTNYIEKKVHNTNKKTS